MTTKAEAWATYQRALDDAREECHRASVAAFAVYRRDRTPETRAEYERAGKAAFAQYKATLAAARDECRRVMWSDGGIRVVRMIGKGAA